MRTPKIYLETTIFNYYIDIERALSPSVHQLFAEVKQGKYEPYTSEYVTSELERAPQPKREAMLALISEYDITVLAISKEADRLAEIYGEEGALPINSLEDRHHIACAAANDLDMIVSLNFQHIVRKKTIEQTEYINQREGYRKIDIYAPMEVIDSDS